LWERSGQRQGLLVSALLHLAVLMGLAAHPVLDGPHVAAPPLARSPRVFLPRPGELRRLNGSYGMFFSFNTA